MKLLLHIGLHRAASTSIQSWLIDNRDQLALQGCFVAAGPQSGLEGTILNILTGQSFGDIPEETLAGIVADDLDARQDRFSAAVMSDENMPGLMPNAGRPPFLRVERLARVLWHLAKRHEVIPLIVLREHVAWLTSLYRVAQARGQTADAATFCRAIALRPDLFAQLVAPITKAVGPGHAIVTSQAAIMADRGRSLLAGVTDSLSLVLAPDATLPHKNASRNPLVCTLIQTFARQGVTLDVRTAPRLPRLLEDLWRDHALGPSAETSEQVARLLRRALQAGGAEPLPLPEARDALALALKEARQPAIPDELRAELRDYFAVDRAWIREHHPRAILEE